MQLIGVVVGALLAVVGATFGAWMNSRREHDKWLRNERLVAYTAFLAATDRLDSAIHFNTRLSKQPFTSEALLRDVLDLVALQSRISIVGPNSAVRTAQLLSVEAVDGAGPDRDEQTNHDADVAFGVARHAFIDVAREVFKAD